MLSDFNFKYILEEDRKTEIKDIRAVPEYAIAFELT